MQEMLFDFGEPEVVAPPTPPPDFVDPFSDDIPPAEEPKPAPEPFKGVVYGGGRQVHGTPAPDDIEPKTPLHGWLKKNYYDLVLQELVVRAKTIEANLLHSAGWEEELKYLLEAYEGDEHRLRADIVDIAKFIRRHNMQPGAFRDNEETKV